MDLNKKDEINPDTCIPCMHVMVITPLTNVSNLFPKKYTAHPLILHIRETEESHTLVMLFQLSLGSLTYMSKDMQEEGRVGRTQIIL